MKHILTKEDLLLNPFFEELRFKEGDEIEIPDNQNNTNDGDDTGGSNPPPDKPRPDKP